MLHGIVIINALMLLKLHNFIATASVSVMCHHAHCSVHDVPVCCSILLHLMYCPASQVCIHLFILSLHASAYSSEVIQLVTPRACFAGGHFYPANFVQMALSLHC